MEMESTTLIALIAGMLALLALVAVGARIARRRRTAALREHFGSEYERALAQHGDRARAERELLARRKRLRKLAIQPLSQEQCDQYGGAWFEVQQRFIDDPAGAVLDADSLVKEVLGARGYPVGKFDQRVADLSVEHADVVHHYRAARAIAAASASGQASTEELRQAMVHFRALFRDLLREPVREGRLSEVPA